MPNINAANISSIRHSEQSSTPPTPASGFSSIFVKSDGFYVINDSGEVTKHIVNTPTTTAQNTIQASADVTPLTVKSHSTQTNDVMQIGDIDAGNYSVFEDDGTLEFNGEATVWDDLQINISSARLPPSGAPSWVSFKGSKVLAFDPAQDNIIYFTAQISHSYAEGEDIEFHVHLSYPDANTGNSIWNFTYSWANMGTAYPTETTVSAVSIASPAIASQHQYAEIIDPISGTGKQLSSMLLCSLEREGTHASDTYASDVYLLAADFHYPKNTVGSRTELSK